MSDIIKDPKAALAHLEEVAPDKVLTTSSDLEGTKIAIETASQLVRLGKAEWREARYAVALAGSLKESIAKAS